MELFTATTPAPCGSLLAHCWFKTAAALASLWCINPFPTVNIFTTENVRARNIDSRAKKLMSSS